LLIDVVPAALGRISHESYINVEEPVLD